MAQGYIVAQVYTSRGVIPIKDATVSVTQEKDNKRILVGVRKTNENGRTSPVLIETPDEELSTSPGNPAPFAVCNLHIEHPDYYTMFIKDVQVFANTTSFQTASLVPIEEQANNKSPVETFQVTPQNL